jgi:putative glutamine amidotransferase
MSGLPVVGVLPGFEAPRSGDDGLRLYAGTLYLECVRAAGGLPFVIDPMSPPAEALAHVDGLLLIGGPDIDPAEYGQPPAPETRTGPPERFRRERLFLDALPPGMPVLGVCYGCQAVNVHRGGDLDQHLSGAEKHEGGKKETVSIEPGTRLSAILGADTAEVLSYHHQACKRLGEGLRVAARASDGTVEALEGVEGGWLVAVQWHPERTAESPASRALFRAFADACRAFRQEVESCGTW